MKTKLVEEEEGEKVGNEPHQLLEVDLVGREP